MLDAVRLRLIRNTWERLARLDPYWAIVNDPGGPQGGGVPREFFESGRALLARQLSLAAAVCPGLRTERALDFGCGVGRVSAALAASYREVVGVDISAEMIALAARHHAAVPNLHFVRNTRPGLAQFDTGSFDLVYSLITLQHLPPRFIRSCLREFARICRPGGVLLFQLPSRELTRRNRWSLWPPTVSMRLRRVFNRLIPINPVIDVHCLGPDRVRAILAVSDVEVLAQWPEDSAGQAYESFLYLGRKQ